MSKDIRKYVGKCVISSTHKLSTKIKPNNKELISYFPLEKVEFLNINGNLLYLINVY